MSARGDYFWLAGWAEPSGWEPPSAEVRAEWAEKARKDGKGILDELDRVRSTGTDDHSRAVITELRRQLHYATERNAERNRQLDALHMVWCDGGCPGGMHRHTDKLTPDEVLALVEVAEHNIARMKRWAQSAQFRAARKTT